MNKLTNENITGVAALLSPVNPPKTNHDTMPLEGTNIVMKWLWRLTDAGYESWKRQGTHDGI
ncbi:MAG: hypothetical protein CBD27_10015 [Rhodospirillaceae bacterium TMED167]|nr:hypothetical protein [Rhodospirillaceae bacterium]MDG2034563.1 hypothetical protein [Rhodospirillales bacterium]OUW25022.1 MAG: hypothetical protein CBD27_10015 [Rhodospirillaceae bacterium TMED167]